ncbi:alanine racemase [Planctomicrobium sp. SH664]|uniref:alanine racemase n=1 Tax=Planctomicrobium sp. SH664 TaxID=3448125 RepID=UPI003F5BCFDF
MVNSFQAAKTELVATPALVIDSATVDRNVERVMQYARTHNIQVRPHAKTHKSVEIAQRQLAAGAIGMTVAKVGEAEMLQGVCADFTVAYPAVDSVRSRRLAELAGDRRVRIAVDSLEGIEALAGAAVTAGSTLGILIDVDVGFHRTGVSSAQDSLQLARRVADFGRGLRLDGMLYYPGHIWSRGEQQTTEMLQIDQQLGEFLDAWCHAGLEASRCTPALFQSHHFRCQTEIRPGTYVYNDMNTFRGGYCELQDCAAAVVCTIVSRAVTGKAVIDGERKPSPAIAISLPPTRGMATCWSIPARKSFG